MLESSRAHPAHRVAYDGRQRLPLRQDSEGIFPAAGYRASAGRVVGEQHISYQALVEKAKWFEEQVRDRPGCRNRHHGGGHQRRRIRREQRATSTFSSSRWGFAKSTSDQVIARLRRKTSGVPGATMFLQNSQDVRIGGRQGNAQYQYTLQAPDFASLAEWGPKVLDRLSTASGDCRRQLRPAEFRLVVQCGHRPRYRLAPRSHGAGRRFRAL